MLCKVLVPNNSRYLPLFNVTKMILDTCTIVKCKAISSKYEKIKFVRASRYAGNIFHYIDIDEILGQQFLGLIFYYL